MSFYGELAQLGEHLPCTQGVKSSILLFSTINLKKVKPEKASEHRQSNNKKPKNKSRNEIEKSKSESKSRSKKVKRPDAKRFIERKDQKIEEKDIRKYMSN